MRVSRPLQQLVKHTLSAPSALVRVRGAPPAPPEADFALYPGFFSEGEARRLLGLALWKLDRLDGARRRRRRGPAPPPAGAEHPGAPLQDMFAGAYGFEEGHFDSVITQFREALVTSFPPDAGDLSWLGRLYALVPGLQETGSVPPPGSSTHALHLAPNGQILPHVDNLEASGQTIVGASLGAARVLRLAATDDPESGWDVLLPSGSVYLQKGAVRYGYKHAILGYDDAGSAWDGARLPPGHRVSFMVRDAPSRPAQL